MSFRDSQGRRTTLTQALQQRQQQAQQAREVAEQAIGIQRPGVSNMTHINWESMRTWAQPPAGMNEIDRIARSFLNEGLFNLGDRLHTTTTEIARPGYPAAPRAVPVPRPGVFSAQSFAAPTPQFNPRPIVSSPIVDQERRNRLALRPSARRAYLFHEGKKAREKTAKTKSKLELALAWGHEYTGRIYSLRRDEYYPEDKMQLQVAGYNVATIDLKTGSLDSIYMPWRGQEIDISRLKNLTRLLWRILGLYAVREKTRTKLIVNGKQLYISDRQTNLFAEGEVQVLKFKNRPIREQLVLDLVVIKKDKKDDVMDKARMQADAQTQGLYYTGRFTY